MFQFQFDFVSAMFGFILCFLIILIGDSLRDGLPSEDDDEDYIDPCPRCGYRKDQ